MPATGSAEREREREIPSGFSVLSSLFFNLLLTRNSPSATAIEGPCAGIEPRLLQPFSGYFIFRQLIRRSRFSWLGTMVPRLPPVSVSFLTCFWFVSCLLGVGGLDGFCLSGRRIRPAVDCFISNSSNSGFFGVPRIRFLSCRSVML